MSLRREQEYLAWIHRHIDAIDAALSAQLAEALRDASTSVLSRNIWRVGQGNAA
jgi:hypothetical protein